MRTQKKEFIHQLIHHMTKAEKKHFTIGANRFNHSKEYLKLYKAIENQAEYDDEALKSNLELSDRKFRKLKHYLKEELIESIVDFKMNINPEPHHKIMKNTIMIESLLDKGLYNDVDEFLLKTKLLQKKTNDIEVNLLLNRYEFSHFPEREHDLEYLEEFYNDYEKQIEELKLNIQLNRIKKQLGVFILTGTDYNREINIEFNEEHLKKKIKNASIHTKDNFYRTALNHYYHQGNLKKALMCAEEWCQLLEKHLGELTNENRYLLALSNAIDLNYSLGNINQCEQYLEKYNSQRKSASHPSYQTWNLLVYSSYSALILIKRGKIHEAKKHIYNVHNRLQDKRLNFVITSGLFIPYATGFLLFLIGDYSNAIQYLQIVVNNSSNTNHPKLFLSGKILLAIVLFEKGDISATESHMRSIYRIIIGQKNTSTYHQLIARLFRTLANSSTKSFASNLKKLQKEFYIIEEEWYKDKFFLNFNMVDWLESKIQDIPLLELMRQNEN